MDRKEVLDLLALEIEAGSHMTIFINKGQYNPTLRIRRREVERLGVIKNGVGGTLALAKDGSWWWNSNSRQLIGLLHGVYDQLREKREHAEIIFKLEESIEEQKKRRGYPLSEEVRAYRDGLVSRIKELNGGSNVYSEGHVG